MYNAASSLQIFGNKESKFVSILTCTCNVVMEWKNHGELKIEIKHIWPFYGFKKIRTDPVASLAFLKEMHGANKARNFCGIEKGRHSKHKSLRKVSDTLFSTKSP